MKHVFTIVAVALLFSLSITTHAQNAKGKSKGAMHTAMHDNDNMPYTAMYSSQFQMGNSKYSRMVLNAWKAYDDNMLDNIAGTIADTVTAELPDGTVLKGRENFLNALKTYRGGFTAVKDEVVAWVPLKSIDKGDDIVFVWGSETDTKNDGTTQRMDIHEVWAFNKDGKLAFFKQFAAQSPKDSQ
jgi:SnoaL-like domain